VDALAVKIHGRCSAAPEIIFRKVQPP